MGAMKRLPMTALCIFVASSTLADPVDAVRCREIAFSKSAETRDIAAFKSFIDEDARFVSNSVLHGALAVAEAWSAFFAAGGPSIKWRPQIVQVLEDGELALTRGPYRVVSVNADGDTLERWGTFNSVWRIGADGEWRVVFDAGSPAASAPDEETKSFLDAGDDCP